MNALVMKSRIQDVTIISANRNVAAPFEHTSAQSMRSNSPHNRRFRQAHSAQESHPAEDADALQRLALLYELSGQLNTEIRLDALLQDMLERLVAVIPGAALGPCCCVMVTRKTCCSKPMCRHMDQP